MGQLMTLALRGVLVVLLAGAACLQGVLIWLLVAGSPDPDAALASVRTPVFLIVVAGAAAAEVVLVCVWRLVTMVRRGTVFSLGAFRYVHIVIGAFVAAALLVCALGVVLAPGEAVAPGIVLMLGGVVVAVLGVALVVLVLRMLLAQAVARDIEATRMRAELAEVI
ncbi:DUF2975 domain-containing protein [Streptomyces rochei]|uniref:DUF2975 domain-containing protein n=2 Tax=Streptomyces rochei group TaxID=2867164 RepID=A0ABW7DZF4_STRRO|nr:MULTISPECIES: DUF2975 domain-containing protein [Streptomyces]MDV6288972.1 DUF2975 domain-containing protein [Streptomyces sp. UP1A-1]UXI79946.1 DUF2975 domain-containing protein [Streptomyces vinaceusdrappus]